MALTIKHVEQADARIVKRFGNTVRRAKADFHFVQKDTVRQEFLKIYPDGSVPDGFVDPTSTPYQVWIPHDHKDETLVNHETMHLYAMWYKSIFAAQFGMNINEGVTEFFTRQVVSERRDSYAAQTAEIIAMVKFLGTEEPLRQAYFQGCFSTWIGAAGSSTIGAWIQQMRGAQWKSARKILGNPPDKPTPAACKAQTAR
jgi:hypothetical protein